MSDLKVTETEDGLIIEHPDDWVYPWNEDLELLKYKLKALLKDNIVEVTFTKLDGTLRTMKCTLKPTLIPHLEMDEEYEWVDVDTFHKRKKPENILAVWDIEKNGWRSFRIESVHDYIVTKAE